MSAAPPILERLAERKVRGGPIARGQIALVERAFHRFDLVVAEPVGLEVRETPPRLAERGIGGHRAAVRCDARFGVAKRLVDVAERELDPRRRGVERERAFEGIDGLGLFQPPRLHGPERGPAFRLFRVQRGRPQGRGFRVVVARSAHGEARLGAVHMAHVRRHGHGPCQEAVRVVRGVAVDGNRGQADEGVHVVGVRLEDVAVDGLGIAGPALGGRLRGLADGVEERIAGDGLPLGVARFFGAPGIEQHVAVTLPGADKVAADFDGPWRDGKRPFQPPDAGSVVAGAHMQQA